jgi:hypothetical protein
MSHNVTEGEEIHPEHVAEVTRWHIRSCRRQGFQGLVLTLAILSRSRSCRSPAYEPASTA